MTTATMQALGLAVTLPPGWDGRIYQRPADPGATTHPILHAATIPLPPVRGDFGGGAVDLLGADDVFLSLLEYHPDSVSQALYRATGGVPGLTPDQFNPFALQRVVPGQAGCQQFFGCGGRAFCLYVVIGGFANRVALTPQANAVLSSVHVEPRR